MSFGVYMAKFKDTNYFNSFSVSNTSFSSNLASWNFISTAIGIFVLSTSASDIIEISFDGESVHDRINPYYVQGVFYDNRHAGKLWLRKQSSGSSVTVQVSAWRNDA